MQFTSNSSNIFFAILALEEMEFFTKERGCMIELRAQKLVESKLNSMAIKFVRHAIRAIRACAPGHMLPTNITSGQYQCIMEIYFTLLLDEEMKSILKKELMAFDIQSAKQFIVNTHKTLRDMAEKTPLKTKKSDKRRSWLDRLREQYIYMSSYVLNVILKRIMDENPPQEINTQSMKEILEIWMYNNRNADDFEEKFRALVNTKSKARIYHCCEYFLETVSHSHHKRLKQNKKKRILRR